MGDDPLVGVGKTILDNVRSMRKQGATADEVRQYLAEAQQQMAALRSASDSDLSGVDTAKGAMRSLAQGATFNFADEIEAAVRAAATSAGLNDESYDDALHQIRSNLGSFRDAHPLASFGLEMAGGMAIPGIGAASLAARGGSLATKIGKVMASGTIQGSLAGLGAGETPEGRALGAVGGGALGFALQSLARSGSTLARAAKAKKLDEVVTARRDAMRAADNAMYGAAGREAGDVGSSAGVERALQLPLVREAAAQVWENPAFHDNIAKTYGRPANKSDLLAAVYRILGQKERTLGAQVEASAVNQNKSFLSGTSLEREGYTLAKKRLLDAADETMPSLRPAVQQHAIAEGQNDALVTGADAADRLINARRIAPASLAERGLSAVRKEISQMSPDEAQAALEGALGTLRNTPHLTANPISGFGTASSVARVLLAPHRLRPLLRDLDARAGTGALARAIEMIGANLSIPLAGRGVSLLEQQQP